MKKIPKRFLTCFMVISLIVTTLPIIAFADLGSVALETKLNNDIVVYENHFADESAFNAVYNKDVDYGIHPINTAAGTEVKFTKEANFTSAGLSATNFESTQIRTYNGDLKTKAKGFWIDLDKVLEDYGPGTYSFSFRVNSPANPGLIEAVLNTAEDQSVLGDIFWESHNDYESSPYVNLGGHVLCRRWYEDGNGNNNHDPLNNVTLSSTTYIPGNAEHLRFFFGGTIFDGYANNRNVGGSKGWTPVFFDDLVITKKANSYQDPALAGGNINLQSTLTPLGNASVTGYLVTAIYDTASNKMLDKTISEELTIDSVTTVNTSLPYPGAGNYKIKSFFFDGFENLSPYTLSYNPHESLMPNNSFESPFTSNYRWIEVVNGAESNVAMSLNEGATFTGVRGVSRGISSSGTWIKIGEGASLSPGTYASPGSQTALSKVLLENGKGTYKIEFMAKTRDANANVRLQVRTYYQDYGKLDSAIGTNENTTNGAYIETATKVASTEWTKFEYEFTAYPYASGLTTSSPYHSGWLSYRKNNYGLYLIGSSTAASDVLYIDEFKVTKVSD